MSGGEISVEFRLGNIAESKCDAIVNPCNRGFLLGHAGVNGALAALAGDEYAAECAQLSATVSNGDTPAEMLVTGAGALQARYVIHVVSPIWDGGERGEREALHRLHEQVLTEASDLGCRSVALPAIGTGSHRFPPEVAASIVVPTVEAVLQGDPKLERVLFVFQTRATLHDYLARSSGAAQRDLLVSGLRDEINGRLRAAGRTELVKAVDKLTDETTLRAIIADARSAYDRALENDIWGGEFSLGSNAVYVRAVEHALERDPSAQPSAGDETRPARVPEVRHQRPHAGEEVVDS